MTRARDLSKLSNSQVFSIDNNFNVGINSTVPAATLDVRGNSVITGILTATSFIGAVTGNVTGTASLASNLTGSPNISVGTITATGNVSVGGTLTYEDVTNIDSVGVITARSDVSIADKIIHTGDTNTAIRFPAADTFTVETAGSEALRVDSSQRLLIGETSAVLDTSNALLQIGAEAGANMVLYRDDSSVTTDDSLGLIRFYSNAGSSKQEHARITAIAGAASGDGDKPGNLLFYTTADGASSPTERLRIDSSGRLLVGASSVRANFYNNASGVETRFLVEGTSFTTSSAALVRNSDNASDAEFILAKSRGGSVGSNTVVQSGDSLGAISFQGSDGAEFVESASITAFVDGTPGSNDMPGRLTFSTTADGATSPTERLRIDSSGKVGININNPGSYNSAGNELVLGNTGNNGGMTIVSGTSNNGHIFFADGTSGGALNRGIIKYEHGNDAMAFNTAETEALRIDSSGRVLVKLGSSIASEPGEGHTPSLQVAHVGGNVTNLGISVSRFQASNPNSVPIILQKSRNDTVGSHTIVVDDDELGRIEFAGSDGSNFRTAAAITGEVDGTPGSSDMPGRLEFKTTADGATSPTERLRITSRGGFQFSNGLMSETVKINTTARTGTQAVNLDDGMVHYFSTNSSGTWKPNFTMSAGDDINATIATGDVISPTMIVAKGATTHFANAIQVDGSDVTPEFLGGAPTDGGASGTFDVYNYTIIKTGNDSFKAFASVSTYE